MVVMIYKRQPNIDIEIVDIELGSINLLRVHLSLACRLHRQADDLFI